MQKQKLKLISIIVPTFKQEKTIRQDLEKIETALSQAGHPYEIIVVVDGNVDRTMEMVKKLASKTIHVYGYKNNYGKGYAIRYGMIHTKGDIVGFIDAGMDLNPNGLSMLLEHFKWYNADIIIGSKRHPVSKVNYPFTRKVISLLSQMLIRLLFGLNVRDTQVGMKFFRRKVIEDILPRLLVKKFAFDIEILVVAYNLGYKRIYEAPIELNFNFQTSLVSKYLVTVLLRTLIDTLTIFYRLKILRYYDDSNKKKWKFDPELKFRVNVG